MSVDQQSIKEMFSGMGVSDEVLADIASENPDLTDTQELEVPVGLPVPTDGNSKVDDILSRFTQESEPSSVEPPQQVKVENDFDLSLFEELPEDYGNFAPFQVPDLPAIPDTPEARSLDEALKRTMGIGLEDIVSTAPLVKQLQERVLKTEKLNQQLFEQVNKRKVQTRLEQQKSEVMEHWSVDENTYQERMQTVAQTFKKLSPELQAYYDRQGSVGAIKIWEKLEQSGKVKTPASLNKKVPEFQKSRSTSNTSKKVKFSELDSLTPAEYAKIAPHIEGLAASGQIDWDH